MGGEQYQKLGFIPGYSGLSLSILVLSGGGEAFRKGPILSLRYNYITRHLRLNYPAGLAPRGLIVLYREFQGISTTLMLGHFRLECAFIFIYFI